MNTIQYLLFSLYNFIDNEIFVPAALILKNNIILLSTISLSLFQTCFLKLSELHMRENYLVE